MPPAAMRMNLVHVVKTTSGPCHFSLQVTPLMQESLFNNKQS